MRAVAMRQDVPDLILNAADSLLGRYGYQKMTIDDIAREVGIGKGTIYLHFKSKEEIALARVDRVIKQLIIRLEEIASGNQSVPDRLRRMLIERVVFRFDSVQHYTESLTDILAAIRPALLVRHQSHFHEEARVFAALLKEGKSRGEFVFKDLSGTASALLTATNALLPYSLSTRELGSRKDVSAQAGRIADLLIDGLKSR